MVFAEGLGHAVDENKGSPACPGRRCPQARRHHAPHVDGWIKVPMGEGGRRRITSITAVDFDPHRIVRRVDDGLDEAENVCCAS